MYRHFREKRRAVWRATAAVVLLAIHLYSQAPSSVQFTNVTQRAGINFVHFKGPLLLHNGGGTGNHFINFRLAGAKSNRDAMGARIRVTAGGIPQSREIEGGGSYLSQSDLRANFGLGKAARAESIEIKWPGGQRQVFRDVEADKFYLIEEGRDTLGLQRFTPIPR